MSPITATSHFLSRRSRAVRLILQRVLCLYIKTGFTFDSASMSSSCFESFNEIHSIHLFFYSYHKPASPLSYRGFRPFSLRWSGCVSLFLNKRAHHSLKFVSMSFSAATLFLLVFTNWVSGCRSFFAERSN